MIVRVGRWVPMMAEMLGSKLVVHSVSKKVTMKVALMV